MKTTRHMKLLLGVLVITTATTAFASIDGKASSESPSTTCGGDHRWDVKTLSDPDADKVRYDTPKRHTIQYMLGRTDPHVGTQTARDADGSHVELTVYQLVGVRLFNARIEADADIHLVIEDKYERKMIVELPNTTCEGAKDSDHVDEMKQARTDFATLCGLPSWDTRTTRASPRPLSGTAAVVGVGFFDLKHGMPQVGVATNNIELHPLLQFSAENCHPT